MRFLIAAAGTGGHVFPGLAVGEALLDLGVARDAVIYVGGDRLEATVYPQAGFPFHEIPLRGLRRNLSSKNLSLPLVVMRARSAIEDLISERMVAAVLGMGGYATIPTALAARGTRRPLFVCEQNAEAGLANRIASRWAMRAFGSFPQTAGLHGGEWVGNPVRRSIVEFDRAALRPQALTRYRLAAELPILGVFGGSLGSRSVNEAVTRMAAAWRGTSPLQILHLAGAARLAEIDTSRAGPGVRWTVIGFEDRMDLFYAACDLIVARAGGAVAELLVTATPSILVPGAFGSGSHQEANARVLEREGAAVVVSPRQMERLHEMVERLLSEPEALSLMSKAAVRLARPRAAEVVAGALIEAAA